MPSRLLNCTRVCLERCLCTVRVGLPISVTKKFNVTSIKLQSYFCTLRDASTLTLCYPPVMAEEDNKWKPREDGDEEEEDDELDETVCA